MNTKALLKTVTNVIKQYGTPFEIYRDEVIKANDRRRAGDTYTADFYTNWSEKFNVKQDDKIVAQDGTKYRVKSIDDLVHYNVCYHLVLERVI